MDRELRSQTPGFYPDDPKTLDLMTKVAGLLPTLMAIFEKLFGGRRGGETAVSDDLDGDSWMLDKASSQGYIDGPKSTYFKRGHKST